jgi:hypothetical protein
MQRRNWIIAAVVLVAVLAAASIQYLFAPRTISSAVSPDGSWSVVVIGKRRFNGAYELVTEIRDRDGRLAPTGAFVVGLTSEITPATEQHYAIRFVDADTAQFAERVLEKRTYFP